MDFIVAFVILGGLGVIFGSLLAFAAKKFAVEEDPRVEKVSDVLPGANCGACGYAGCTNFAEEVVGGNAPPDLCIPGGKDVIDQVCSILGMESIASDEKKIAEVYCLGIKDVAPERFEYQGVPDCEAAANFGGGFKACTYGCLGFGNCVDVCPFDALSMGEDGLPHIVLERCTGCGICAKACPRGIIRVVNANRRGKVVLCSSKDRGKTARQACEVGCIGCKACVKACPQEAIVVEENLAYIDNEKCDNCGKCVDACKRDIIKDVPKVSVEV